MFARTSIYELPDEGRDDAADAFAEALGQIAESGGYRGGWFLVSCDGNRAATVTLWETREAMEASRVSASRLRSAAAAKAGGGVVSSEEFEVAAEVSPNVTAY